METKPEEAYVFDLHLVAGGYAYYSTMSRWGGWAKDEKHAQHGRDRRVPDPTIIVANFEKALNALGQKAVIIQTASDYECWLLRRGWAIVPVEVAREVMAQWLKAHDCVADAPGFFTDVALVSDSANARDASSKKQEIVKQRDGGRCLRCGRTQQDGIKITIHHVRAFSRGGVSLTGNCVSTCASCNQAIGTDHLPEFYQLAGLPYGYDLGLFNAEVTWEAIEYAMKITLNMMYSRCDVF